MKLLQILKLSTGVMLANAVLLEACAGPSEPRIQTTPTITPIKSLVTKPSPAANPRKPAKEPAVQAEKTKPAEKASQTPPAAKGKDYAALIPKENRDPETLLGLKPDRLIKILGPPGFRRADTPAEIWQYQYEGCVLNLILYETGKGKTLSVTHYTIRSIKKNEVSEWNCLLSLLIDRQKKLDGVTVEHFPTLRGH